jgi:uncharacterized protein YjeT (DUF2065 family)
MMLFARPIGEFVSHHPTVKMLGLSFRVVIGLVLIAEGLHHHVPKGCLYFAMAFLLVVERLNSRLRRAGDKRAALNPSKIPGDLSGWRLVGGDQDRWKLTRVATDAAGVWPVATKASGD